MAHREPEINEKRAQKRKIVLAVFGGLAIALAAALVSISPSFPPDRSADVTGAIGAVQKHRAPQITAQDVILGDETVKRQEAVIHGDYFRDAATLRSISAQLAALASHGEQSAEARDQIANALQALANHRAELQGRYVLAAQDSLKRLDQLGAKTPANVAGLEAGLVGDGGSRAQLEGGMQGDGGSRLSSAEMGAINNRLMAAMESLQSRAVAVRFNKMESQLEAAFASAASQKRLSNEQALAAASRLQNLGESLANESALAVMSMNREYLQAMAAQAETLQNSEQQLSNESALAVRYANVANALANEANRLEAQALENMASRFEARLLMARFLNHIESQLASRKLAVQSVDNEALAAYDRALNQFEQQLESEAAEMNVRFAAQTQAELASISAHLANIEQNNARIGSESALAAHLAALSQSLEQRNLGRAAALGNGEALQAQARALHNRAAQLSVRAQ